MTNAPRTFDVLVVGGGGGSGNHRDGSSGAAGSGNGQPVEQFAVALATGSTSVTIGAGGAAGGGPPSIGGAGGTSSFGTVIAAGGGGGGQTASGCHNMMGCPYTGTTYTPLISHMSGASASYANGTWGGGVPPSPGRSGLPGVVIVRYEIAP